MAHVFISYSRVDKEFVRKLSDALADQKREAWIDWKDIPLTAEWQQEILTNIEAAENFLFVISSRSVASSNCRKEIDHAVANNKRMFPIIRENVPDEAIPESLGKFQWLDFSRDDVFEAGLAALITALDADLAWVKAHTRLLTRAIEWERGASDGSFLLHGKDLREAERWMAGSSEKNPKPTTLQSRYILASRQAATNLQRIVIGAVTMAFLIAVGLAVYAFIQRNLAERETAQARARELAAYADASLNEDPQRSLLLALQAVNSTLKFKEAPVPAAENALHDAVFNSLVRLTLRGHSGHVTSVAFSGDGKRVATGGDDNKVRIWDAVNGRAQLTLSDFAGHVNALAFSPDGGRLLTGSQTTITLDADGNIRVIGKVDDTARIWDAVTGREIMVLKGHSNLVTAVAYSPDGRLVATADDHQATRVWNAATGAVVVTLQGHAGSESRLFKGIISTVSFNADGSYLATANPDETATIWDTRSGEEFLTLHTPSRSIRGVAFSPDGKRVATAENDTARVWDASTGQEQLTLKGHHDQVVAIAFSPDGRYLATGSWDKTAKIWDLNDGSQELATLWGHSDFVTAVAFSPDGKRLATASWDGTAKVWNSVGEPELVTLRGSASNVIAKMAFSPDGKKIAGTTDAQPAKIFDVVTGAEVVTFRGQASDFSAVAFSPDGRYLAAGGKTGTAKMWDAVSGRELLSVGRSSGSAVDFIGVQAVAVSPDNKRLAIGDSDGTATVWNATNGQELFKLHGHSSLVDTIEFSPDGTLLATGSFDRTAKVWDAAGGRELRALRGHSYGVARVAFSPDGRRLATASLDGTAKVWDAVGGEELTTLRGHSEPVNDIAFSPDGGRLVTASADGTVRLWDPGNGQQLLSLRGYLPVVSRVTFSRDGRHLAATGSNRVQTYTLDIHELLSMAHKRIARQPPIFTPEECKRYFPSQVCPGQP